MAQPVGVAGGPARLPPKPPKPSPVSKGISAITAPVQHAAQTITHAVAPPRPPRPRGGSDAVSSGSDYGSAKASAYKTTPKYAAAVKAVFAHQPVKQKAAIIVGSSRNAQTDPYTAKAVREAMDDLPIFEKTTLAKYLPHNTGITPGQLVGDVAKSVYSLTDQHNPLAGAYKPQTLPAEKLLAAGGKGAAGLIQRIPTGIGTPKEQKVIQEQSIGLGPGQLGKNLAKDAINLPAEALPSIAIPASEAATGHFKQALQAVTGPYVQAIEHPKTIGQHPGNALLMFGGLLHPTARTLDQAQTLARTGELPNIKAESVHLTGNLTHERPDFSKSPIIRRSQKDVAKSLYQRNDQGKLVPRSEAVHARLVKLETSRLVGQNERVRTAHRSQQIEAHAKTVLLPKAKRAIYNTRKALTYNPKAGLTPGADVLARIADGTIRRPDTVEKDLETHLRQVAANRPNLEGKPQAIKDHDAYIAELKSALKNKSFLKNPAPAFKAASQYAKDYAPLEQQAHELGHFREMDKTALERRTLAHAVLTHMKGAHVDPEHGLSVGGRALSTDEMRQFVANQTGGRKLAFTTDQAKSGDRAFYVSGQKRPPVAAQGNTYFNFTHGLTHPGHESLLEQRVRTQGIVDAHNSMNRLADQLLVQNERTGNVKAWGTFQAAKRDAPPGYQPIRLAQQFHPQGSLAKALETGKVDLRSLEEEAASRSLDINSRLHEGSEPGQYALINEHAAAQLRAHEGLISPNTFYRGLRGLTGQFRTVALATSFRHLPGVFQEQLIRAAMEGIGPISWLAGRGAMKRAREINPELGERRMIEATGGGPTGQALALRTRQVSRHFAGSLLEPPLAAWEKFAVNPGIRQLRTAWHAWTHFTLQGTKRFLEENTAQAAIGKQVIADFGSRHGLLAAAMGKWGQMVDEAAHGILDENTARQMGAYVRRVYGRWTDLTPGEQAALMFSPFGMWWTNSVAWLARMPVDHPVGAAFLAALNTGTEKQRQKLGLDMFSPGHLPLYQQGSVLIGGKLWNPSYYSAFGVAGNPGETAASLIAPWQSELWNAARGKDWKGDTINSPGNPKGRNKPPFADVLSVILNSAAGSFIPLYTKAEQVVTGGASSYDTSSVTSPQTKQANPGPLKGLEKAVMPIRLANATPPGSGAPGKVVFPGSGGTGGVVIPGHGSTNGVVIP